LTASRAGCWRRRGVRRPRPWWPRWRTRTGMGRGRDREYERASYGSQYASMAPLFAHYGVALWTPETGGPVDGGEDHDRPARRVLSTGARCASTAMPLNRRTTRTARRHPRPPAEQPLHPVRGPVPGPPGRRSPVPPGQITHQRGVLTCLQPRLPRAKHGRSSSSSSSRFRRPSRAPILTAAPASGFVVFTHA
jgi:hypothetical protein